MNSTQRIGINPVSLLLIGGALLLNLTGCGSSQGTPEETAQTTQEECDRPKQMDGQYCDRNQDLVADPPDNPDEWINPDTLIFAYLPIPNPDQYESVWTEFMAHLSEITGKPVQFLALESKADQIQALKDGQLHIAGFSTSTVPIAVNQAGFTPFAMMAASDGTFGYEMEIITHISSPLDSLENLSDRQLAFTDANSYSGYILPRALLEAGYNLKADRDYKAVFSGSQEKSIVGVQNQTYEAAAIANDVLQLMCNRQEADCSQFRSLYQSQTFPNAAYGYAHNLDPELVGAIDNAFLTFNWSGTGLEREFSATGEEKFIPIDYQIDWSQIRTIQEAQGVDYQVPSD
ncbi:phosphate/phosphite/phosphonate ABC transporter substrate-binding protein [Roseofilum reptotaenium CS-1145]|nr:phosphate/phosphite/phosphonate ABC transporter substrate-binding protein [Roseofilum reptotaenium]MDB9517004.1 phosphate/phosphite/phosphonate ABC transporter substrate-binding protein [Roseofilum reptotaenium CS-1145]